MVQHSKSEETVIFRESVHCATPADGGFKVYKAVEANSSAQWRGKRYTAVSRGLQDTSHAKPGAVLASLCEVTAGQGSGGSRARGLGGAEGQGGREGGQQI